MSILVFSCICRRPSVTEIYCRSTIIDAFVLQYRYAKSKNIQALSWKSHVCGQCLVGKRIPVFRPSIDKWQIGEVKTFHWQTQQHVVLFDENDRESVDVSSSPFHDYVSHCKEIQVDADKKEAPCQARLADMESIATCSPIRYKFEGADNLVFRNDEFFYERGSEKVSQKSIYIDDAHRVPTTSCDMTQLTRRFP